MAIVIGFQAVLFSVLGKVFAWQEGLLPIGEGFQRLFRYITLEVGLAVGVALMLAGLAGSIYAFVRWSVVSFGELDVSRILRIVFRRLRPCSSGAQIVLASFFFSLLGIQSHASAGPDTTATNMAETQGVD